MITIAIVLFFFVFVAVCCCRDGEVIEALVHHSIVRLVTLVPDSLFSPWRFILMYLISLSLSLLLLQVGSSATVASVRGAPARNLLLFPLDRSRLFPRGEARLLPCDPLPAQRFVHVHRRALRCPHARARGNLPRPDHAHGVQVRVLDIDDGGHQRDALVPHQFFQDHEARVHGQRGDRLGTIEHGIRH